MCWACTCTVCSRTPPCCTPVWRPAPTLDAVFDGLADGVARHFDPGVLDALIA
jgi:hypothetical protein